MILADSNVLIAALVDRHPHHLPSVEFLGGPDQTDILIATHCLAEALGNLTRPFPGHGLPPVTVKSQIDSLIQNLHVVQLDALATLDAIRRFALQGGVGPRLYDYLIGATGEAFGADTIVTWNVRHFVPLFPHLRIVTPAEFTAPIS